MPDAPTQADFDELRAILADLGFDAGPEVLHLWLDRAAHGREPMPYDALVHLAMWSMRMCDQARARGRGAANG